LHGHNYIVEVILESMTLDSAGFVRDYGDLNLLKNYLNDEIDHRHLNDILGDHTSAEQLARYFYDWCRAHWPEVIAVRISESPNTWAEYRGQ
jgi:6-pyruvoyltetrahydropterin/6-carboxytetrahydropterin synthase